jgi:hypothetical protein
MILISWTSRCSRWMRHFGLICDSVFVDHVSVATWGLSNGVHITLDCRESFLDLSTLVRAWRRRPTLTGAKSLRERSAMSKKVIAKRKTFVWAVIFDILFPAVNEYTECWQKVCSVALLTTIVITAIGCKCSKNLQVAWCSTVAVDSLT